MLVFPVRLSGDIFTGFGIDPFCFEIREFTEENLCIGLPKIVLQFMVKENNKWQQNCYIFMRDLYDNISRENLSFAYAKIIRDMHCENCSAYMYRKN